MWLPDAEKSFEDTLFDRFHGRDRRIDGRTPQYGIGRACIASRGKNCRNSVGLLAIRLCSRSRNVQYCAAAFTKRFAEISEVLTRRFYSALK